MNREILKSKTFWAGILAIIGAVAGYLTGEMDMNAALAVAVPGLVGIFLKDGQITGEKKIEKAP